jgi:hypothetical protein
MKLLFPKLFVTIFARDWTGSVHAPTESLGQRWQRTQMGNEKVSRTFWGCRIFFCIECVGIKFPMCSQHVPHKSSLYPISFALSSTLVTSKEEIIKNLFWDQSPINIDGPIQVLTTNEYELQHSRYHLHGGNVYTYADHKVWLLFFLCIFWSLTYSTKSL